MTIEISKVSKNASAINIEWSDGEKSNFKITKDQINKEMLEWSGDLISLYYHVEDNYQKLNIPNYGKKKRGRPRKVA